MSVKVVIACDEDGCTTTAVLADSAAVLDVFEEIDFGSYSDTSGWVDGVWSSPDGWGRSGTKVLCPVHASRTAGS